MAYRELIKDFKKIRDYMREFYVYGLKSREEYTRKSARTYDDEKRRLESWLNNYMREKKTHEGKVVSISIDSRKVRHNPFFRAWRTKSFTDGDINLHFILMNVLGEKEEAISFREIVNRVEAYLCDFEEEGLSDEPLCFDESTIRKKLQEYHSLGLLLAEKRGKSMYYRLSVEKQIPSKEMLDFFSEIAPCGVLGYFLLDSFPEKVSFFRFKHHYMTGAMDSGILAELFSAMREKRSVKIKLFLKRSNCEAERELIPLKIRMSAQTGRQYLMAYSFERNRIFSVRIDHILSVKAFEKSDRFDELRRSLERMKAHLWAVNTEGSKGRHLEKVSFCVHYDKNEDFIHNRLVREKRCGAVVKLSENESRFTAEVYDSEELLPWIRSFIGRITEITFSNERLQKKFLKDLGIMYALYELEEEE